MKNDEKAKIILEHLDEYLQVNWAFEKYYIKGIMNGLREIDKKEAETERIKKASNFAESQAK